MSKPKKKVSTKVLANQRRSKRRWLTFLRMCRYGINNFSRNAWLTVAATAVMTITLLIVFVTLSARSVLLDTVDTIRERVDYSIYVRTDTPDEAAEEIEDELRALASVNTVTYVDPEEGRANFAQQHAANNDVLDAITEATNQFPGVFRVSVEDINDPSDLESYLETSELMAEYEDPDREASFAGERRAAIESIGRAVVFAENLGLLASVIFIVISSLIVFNTIRMAIFNRKEEIQMMKLIGAERSFIRGPFVVEAVVYGILAAILALLIGIGILHFTREPLLNYEVASQSTLDFVLMYWPFVLIAMMLAGSAIGVVSSLFATRRYLKI